LVEKLQVEKERLDRIFHSIEKCEQKARKIGLYKANKSE
jgi:hypothetical protein